MVFRPESQHFPYTQQDTGNHAFPETLFGKSDPFGAANAMII